MPLPPAYYPVYAYHPRLPEPSLHAHPLIQTPPLLHLEGAHCVRWSFSDARKLSTTVFGDAQPFALKDFDSGRFIPHLPLPVIPGPFLLETLNGTRYQILFHQPNVLLDGQAVGIFQWGIAPPWRCIELALPLPKFLARARARKLGKAHAAARAERAEVERALERQKGDDASEEGAQARQLKEAGAAQLAAAREKESAAAERVRLHDEHLALEERVRKAREAERAARTKKRECDRLRRRGRQLSLQHDVAATAAFERAQLSGGPAQSRELDVAKQHRAQAATARQGARAWEAEAGAHEEQELVRRREWKQARASWREAEVKKAKQRGFRDPENPIKKATGTSNTGLLAPSLLAHVPLPSTVEIQVSWSQIRDGWIAGLLSAAAEMLKAYVGFVFNELLTPGRGKLATVGLDLVRSVVNDTLIDGGAKYLTTGTLPFKLSMKGGSFGGSMQLERDAEGKWKWKTTLEFKRRDALGVLNTKASLEGQPGTIDKASVEYLSGVEEYPLSRPPVDYGHGIPAVN